MPRIPNLTEIKRLGSKLLNEIEQYVRSYVILPAPAYLPVALWAAATHGVQQFDCFPYIAVVSAAKRSGKTPAG